MFINDQTSAYQLTVKKAFTLSKGTCSSMTRNISRLWRKPSQPVMKKTFTLSNSTCSSVTTDIYYQLIVKKTITLTPLLPQALKYLGWMIQGHDIFQSYYPITSIFTMLFDENLLTCQCEKEDKKGFKSCTFMVFNDIMAVKGLITGTGSSVTRAISCNQTKLQMQYNRTCVHSASWHSATDQQFVRTAAGLRGQCGWFSMLQSAPLS